ncbi:DNA replication factor Cdt1 [Copidosoma floridanum]|uniref:DNA replication factor Cdt1 n=1 Tax=Copidosoma floridanum TaxID=29053 RepID=UPI0006C948D8|nr:DNA replication factor Cdt1 [Copidosoma floridanum]
MSQPSVAAYFTSRKRPAQEELKNKAKVLLLGDDEQRQQALPSLILPSEKPVKAESGKTKMDFKKDLVARNLLSDLSSKPGRLSKTRTTKSKKPSANEDVRQQNIDSMFKLKEPSDGTCVFAKLGNLSPKKSVKTHASKSSKTHQKVSGKATQTTQTEEKNLQEAEACKTPTKEPAIFKTPTKEPTIFKTPTKNSVRELSYDEIKGKVLVSARLKELRAKIAQFQNSEKKLESLEEAHKKKKEEMTKDEERVRIKKFDHIEIEIPVSPQKAFSSPNKLFSPQKTISALSPMASPVRRLLFEPKEEPASLVKASPTKTPAYQRYQSLSIAEGKELPLPYKYRFLLEIFRSIDTISAMLYNRREMITFKKLKPAVQELMRRNFTLDNVAQIKTVWPDAFSFRYEKMRSFGTSNSEKYELVITPNIQQEKKSSGRNTPNEEDVIKSANDTNMNPQILLKRRHIFMKLLLEKVKDEHEEYLQSLEVPLLVSRDKITKWHPAFDLESCKDIDKADLPKEPIMDKFNSARGVLEAANNMFNKNSRMQRALEILVTNKTEVSSPTVTDVKTSIGDSQLKLNSSVVDTPPATPNSQPKDLSNSMLSGIPASLLEKIRAKQAAKALELMTRSEDAHKEAAMHARLPSMAKIVRNIFVTEKKNVLPLEQVVQKLDDSFRTKLTTNKLEEHLKLLCKLLPLWINLVVVRNVKYVKLARDCDMVKIIHRLEVLAEEKV